MNNGYDIVFDSERADDSVRTALAATLSLTAEDWRVLAAGGSASRAVHPALSLALRVQVDSEGVVLFERIQ